MDNDTLRVIARRRSTRTYTDEAVSREALEAVVEAGLNAPYAGDQLCHIAAVADRALIDRMSAAAKQAALTMGMPHLRTLGADPNFHATYGAPALLVVSGAQGGVARDCDCAAAAQNMLIAAESLGLGACWIFFVLLAFEGPQGGGLREALGIPDGHAPVAAVALGHRADASPPPEKRRGTVSYIS